MLLIFIMVVSVAFLVFNVINIMEHEDARHMHHTTPSRVVHGVIATLLGFILILTCLILHISDLKDEHRGELSVQKTEEEIAQTVANEIELRVEEGWQEARNEIEKWRDKMADTYRKQYDRARRHWDRQNDDNFIRNPADRARETAADMETAVREEVRREVPMEVARQLDERLDGSVRLEVERQLDGRPAESTKEVSTKAPDNSRNGIVINVYENEDAVK